MSQFNRWNGLPVVIFGRGGAAKEAKFIIDDINAFGNTKIYDFLGFVSENEDEVGKEYEGSTIVCGDRGFCEFSGKFQTLGVVLPFEKPQIKRLIAGRLQALNNIVFPNIVHPKAIIAKSDGTKTGGGVIIGANAIIDPCVKIGDFVFINIASTIGHDSRLGDFTTIHIGANIAGSCDISEDCIVGANTSVKQGVSIGKGAVCGMGSIVVEDVPGDSVVVSGKAKRIK